jgi:hypothetical protein
MEGMLSSIQWRLFATRFCHSSTEVAAEGWFIGGAKRSAAYLHHFVVFVLPASGPVQSIRQGAGLAAAESDLCMVRIVLCGRRHTGKPAQAQLIATAQDMSVQVWSFNSGVAGMIATDRIAKAGTHSFVCHPRLRHAHR